MQLGGKLGRHLQLAKELTGLFSEDEVLRIVHDTVTFLKLTAKRATALPTCWVHSFTNCFVQPSLSVDLKLSFSEKELLTRSFF